MGVGSVVKREILDEMFAMWKNDSIFVGDCVSTELSETGKRSLRTGYIQQTFLPVLFQESMYDIRIHSRPFVRRTGRRTNG